MSSLAASLARLGPSSALLGNSSDKLLDFHDQSTGLAAHASRLNRFSAPTAMLERSSLAPPQTFSRPRAGALAPMHSTAPVRHGCTPAGLTGPFALGAAPRAAVGPIQQQAPPGGFAIRASYPVRPGRRHRSARPCGSVAVTLPATTACPPSATVTCCTVTTCRLPLRSLSNASAP